jgi:hypothetical protein
MSSEASSISSFLPSESKQGLRGNGVSNERYPASSFNSIEVFDALATTVDSKVLGQMQVFVIISSKIDFIQKTMFISLHRLIRALMGSFPAAFVAPSWNREYLNTFCTLCRGGHLYP